MDNPETHNINDKTQNENKIVSWKENVLRFTEILPF
jgi:hypothetical protein